MITTPRNNFFFILLLLLIIPIQALPSNSFLIDENYIIHLDKSFYVSGEIIWYKIYLPKKFKDQQVSFEIKLVDHEGKLNSNFFLKNEGRTYLHGHYEILFTAPSGIYHLLVFGTNQDSHELVKLANATIPIYNDLKPSSHPQSSNSTTLTNTKENTQIGDLQIEINWEQGIVQKRGIVAGELSIKDQAGYPVKANISMAVTDWELMNVDGLNNNSISITPDIKNINPTDLKNGLHLTGFIKTEAGEPSSANILGYYSRKETRLRYSRTDEKGQFFIVLDSFYGTKPIQFMDYESEGISIEFQQQFDVEKTATLPFNQTIENYLQISKRRKKTYQYFDTKEFPIAPQEENFITTELKNFKRIEIDKYESFKDLPTFLLEITSPLEFELDKADHYIADFFINKYGGIEKIHRQPLFIIDGKMTRNADFVARIPIEKVLYIDLVNDLKKLRKQFGPIGQYGVAVVTTKPGNQKLPPSEENDIFEIPGFQREIPFPVFDPYQMSKDEQQPMLRPQVYWNPTLETDEKGIADFSFFQSDDLGTFRIEVVVQSEAGDYGYGTWFYQVVY